MQTHKVMKQMGNVARSVVTAGVAWVALAGGVAQAQEKENTKTNPLSVREISDNDIMMKKTIWRRVDLKEKQNQAMFSKNNEITRYLIDAVKAGVLVPYKTDSVATPMSVDEFAQKLAAPNQTNALTKEEIEAGFGAQKADDGWGDATKKKADTKKPADDGWGTPAPKTAKAQPADDGWGSPAPKKKATAKNTKGKKGVKKAPVVPEAPKVDTMAVAKADPFASGDMRFASEFSVLNIKEDWVFDRKRSRLYYDIQTVTMALPADKNEAGLEVPIASFKYKDLDKLFRSDPKKFIWYNSQNQAQHKNLADAFDLRLFWGRIYKVSNPSDRDLIGIYGNEREGLLKSYQTEQELMEAEHGLWEY